MNFFKGNIEPKTTVKNPNIDINKGLGKIDTKVEKILNPTTYKEVAYEKKVEMKYYEHLPKSHGTWTGERGNSVWIPDSDYIPPGKNAKDGGTNPEQKSWGKLKKEYKIDGITFKDGEPDFSPVSKGEVKIDEFTTDRDSNFSQADEKLAEQKKCSPEEVEKWRKENGYTWHELKDCKTMQKVPREIHNHIEHSGGISEKNRINKENNSVEGE